MEYEIKSPGEVTEQMVLDIGTKIDSICYPEQEFMQTIKIFQANPLSYFTLFHNGTLYGYLCLFPISEKAYSKIIEELDESFCLKITPADILRYESGRHYRLLVDSLAILPSYKGRVMLRRLVAALVKFILSSEQKGIIIEELVAYALNPDIISFIERINFKRIGETRVYVCKSSDLLKIWYRQKKEGKA
jgi:GNAT superfamily N-acetyltransferase